MNARDVMFAIYVDGFRLGISMFLLYGLGWVKGVVFGDAVENGEVS